MAGQKACKRDRGEGGKRGEKRGKWREEEGGERRKEGGRRKNGRVKCSHVIM